MAKLLQRKYRRRWAHLAAAVVLATTTPAVGQILPRSGLPLPSVDLPDLSRTDLPDTRALTGRAEELAGRTLQRARNLRIEALLRDHSRIVEADDYGAPVVRGQVLALAPSADALAKLQAAGFAIEDRPGLDGLDIGLIVLRPPAGLSARAAVRRARELDPQGRYDFNHLYLEAGGPSSEPPAARAAGGVRVGLIDGGVDPRHPALRSARIEQRGFAPGGVKPRAHGLAVAALLAGQQDRFRGAAPGADLYVADVYGATPAGGSAAAIAQALGWMAKARVGVVNVSLVGPPNLALEAAVHALVGRGHLIVAAVGNDGPAARPLFPAAYPGVIAVTAVDGRRRLLPEAGRPPRIDFAAPGADMAAPATGGGFVGVRGTSFAAPIVAGALARDLPSPDPAAAARATARLAQAAEDLGPKGPDRLYGKGLVGFSMVVRPAEVAAKGMLTQP